MNFFYRIYSYFDFLCNLFQDKKWGKLLIHIAAILLGTICSGLLLGKIWYYISTNFDAIVKVVGGTFLSVIMLIYMLPKRKPTPVLPEDTNGYDPVLLGNTYTLLRQNLLCIISEVSDMLHLRIPAAPSQLDAPVHHDLVSNSVIYHYLCGKQDSALGIDTYEAIGIIQNTLERRLNNHELAGITQTTTFYNGIAYPSLMVDNVQDMGRYIQIDIAIANENYLRYRTSRIYKSMSNGTSVSPHDRDF